MRAVDAERCRRVNGVRDVKVTIGEAIVTTDHPVDERVLREAVQDERLRGRLSLPGAPD